MKSISLVGFGSHVQKNILPAIRRCNDLLLKAVYVRRPVEYQERFGALDLQFRSITEMGEQQADWIYIATPIASHVTLAKHCLQTGYNVICEKPLASSRADAAELLRIARECGRQIVEVNMYKYHAQFRELSALVSADSAKISRFDATFQIPHLASNDIRYDNAQGGGALLDVGFYPFSIAIELFGRPNHFKYISHTESGYSVDLSGVCILDYGGFYGVLEWGIGRIYKNSFSYETEERQIEAQRCFSKPLDFIATINEIKQGKKINLWSGEDDHFVNMLNTCVHGNLSFDLTSSQDVLGLLEQLK
jgi:predicted dehydrogenase